MGVNVTFYLGKGSTKITARALVINNVSVFPIVQLTSQSLGGTDETATVELPENIMCELTLQDTFTGSLTGPVRRFGFSTNWNAIQLNQDSGEIKIIAVEETSSSSSTSSLSSTSTSSESSSSSSSTSTSTSTSSFSSLSSSSTSSLSSTSTSSLSSTSTSSLSSSSSSSS